MRRDEVLTYTGHPLVDVGVATLTAYARRDQPHTLTGDDLNSAAAWLAKLYTEPGPMRGLGRGMVFLNAGYTSSANPDLQQAHVRRVLYGWQADAPHLEGETCVFCGRAAAYRATREEVPMLNGRAVSNFGPAGQAGQPICGWCSLALQMLPLGCVKSGGSLIAAHSSDPRLTLALARAALQRVRRALTLATDDKLPGVPFERTRLVEMLVDWLAASDRIQPAPDLTGYVFTNNGPDPSIKLYRMESSVVSFLEVVMHHADGSLTAAWNRMVERGWKQREAADRREQANRLYEALLKLPDNAADVLRQHVLPAHHWGLAAEYLRRIMNMEPEKIALLKQLGERFAAYAVQKRAFFFGFSRTDDYSPWRRLVLRAADDSMRLYDQPLITFDEFVAAFTAPPGEINDWRLARDLITLLMIEKRVLVGEQLFDDSDTQTDLLSDSE